MRLLLAACLAGAGWTGASPPVWPELVHAHCSQRIPGSAPGEDQLSQVELYYDWAAGRNANLIRGQHDALGPNDYVFTRFKDGEIVAVTN